MKEWTWSFLSLTSSLAIEWHQISLSFCAPHFPLLHMLPLCNVLCSESSAWSCCQCCALILTKPWATQTCLFIKQKVYNLKCLCVTGNRLRMWIINSCLLMFSIHWKTEQCFQNSKVILVLFFFKPFCALTRKSYLGIPRGKGLCKPLQDVSNLKNKLLAICFVNVA